MLVGILTYQDIMFALYKFEIVNLSCTNPAFSGLSRNRLIASCRSIRPLTLLKPSFSAYRVSSAWEMSPIANRSSTFVPISAIAFGLRLGWVLASPTLTFTLSKPSIGPCCHQPYSAMWVILSVTVSLLFSLSS